MEMIFELACIHVGMRLGYGRPGTFTSTSPMMVKRPMQVGDAAALKPTVLVFSPVGLDRLYNVIRSMSNPTASGQRRRGRRGATPFRATATMKNMAFTQAIGAGVRAFDNNAIGAGFPWDQLVFNKTAEYLGGNVRLIVTGGAPLSRDVQKFTQACFSCPVRQSYGCTETCAGNCIAPILDNLEGQVGPPAPNVAVRLRDWDEGGYRFADAKDRTIGVHRGEVLIGGPTVSPGYIMPESGDEALAKKNKESFVTIQGVRYFCTGDVGLITPQGCVAIVDRKSDLVKLKNGEYVALAKVENALQTNECIAQSMVYAEGTEAYSILVAVAKVRGSAR